MEKTTRRHLLKAAAVGGVTVAGLSAAALAATGEKKAPGAHGGHQDRGDHDRRANHTVSFGNWTPSIATPLDRMLPLTPTGDDGPNPRIRNGHFLIPDPIRVHAGDTVSFIISGFHNLLVYGPNIQPSDIDRTKLLLAAGFPPLINDDRFRVYRGLDPRSMPGNQDRVEVVAFNENGRFMVMCGVLPHFFEAPRNEFVMYGYVDVNS
jgi:plastocyanin